MAEARAVKSGADEGFGSLGLSPATMAAIEALGFERPTPIQTQTIPILLEGHDVVAQAQTGTGKTAAYGLPLVELVDLEVQRVQALVLCPTRELAVQVSEAVYSFGRTQRARVCPVYGGQPIDRQIRALAAGVHIVAGTPGRLLDHIRRETLDLTCVRTVILDEADEMLAMGFIEDIETILGCLPADRQTALFSATMPAAIVRLSKRYLREPRRVTIAAESRTVPRIRQSFYQVWPAQKMDALFRVLDMETPGPTIIFCSTKRTTDEVAEHLRGRGCLAEGMHGDLNQRDRDRVMRRFKEGRVELLVATDVAARGLDIETVTHVINYDIPMDVESYTHRIGRTGRAGREGDAITLVTPRELGQLRYIERSTRTHIQAMRLPTDADPAEASAGARPEGGMARLSLSIGRREGLRPSDLVGAIANETGLPGREIGAIDILDHESFVEVPEGRADEVARALVHTTLRGQKVRVTCGAGEAVTSPGSPDKLRVPIPRRAPAAVRAGPIRAAGVERGTRPPGRRRPARGA